MTPQLDATLPSGNIRLLRHEGDIFFLSPDLRDTDGFWFYWKFRVLGAAGRTLTFRFEGGPCLTSRGPVFSRDRGASWAWLSAHHDTPEDHFDFTFADGDDEVWFCMCIPYGPTEWERFLKPIGLPGPTPILCTTPSGHSVPLLELDGPSGTPSILLTARHHCCETPANFVMEGFIRRWADLRPAPLLALPFMDLDGVIAGDQGKNRNGHDHNRDYGPGSRYPEVRALKSLVAERGGPFRMIDLHAPWIRHGINELVYFPGPEDPQQAAALGRLSTRLESLARGLPFDPRDNLSFGRGWNVPSNYSAGLSCAKWMGQQPGCRLAATLEIPYANAAGTPVTPENARAFGQSLAEAMAS